MESRTILSRSLLLLGLERKPSRRPRQPPRPRVVRIESGGLGAQEADRPALRGADQLILAAHGGIDRHVRLLSRQCRGLPRVGGPASRDGRSPAERGQTSVLPGSYGRRHGRARPPGVHTLGNRSPRGQGGTSSKAPRSPAARTGEGDANREATGLQRCGFPHPSAFGATAWGSSSCPLDASSETCHSCPRTAG
jgi:hypothetical protein